MTISKPDADRMTPTGPGARRRKGSARSLGLLALLPIACCGLPLLLAAVAAGTGAVLGGAAGAVLLLAAAVLTVVVVRRRRTAACRTDIDGPVKARKGCC